MTSAESPTLRIRWTQPPLRDVASSIFNALRAGKRLKARHLRVHEGRIDLRGLPLPKPVPKGKLKLPSSESAPSFEFTIIRGRFEAANVSLKRVDLSFSDLSHAVWKACDFEDSLLCKAIVSQGFFRSCHFEDVVFDGADLRDTLVGGCEGETITSFKRTSFRNADLRHTYYQYPVFEDCDFSHAKLDGVDFQGSRFTRCKFAGKMTRLWFRGLYTSPSTSRGTKHRARLRTTGIDPDSIWNPMADVDFSEAYLDDSMFVNQIDLSRCRFPDDGVHIVVKDREKVYSAVGKEIAESWSEPARSEALALLERFANRKDQVGQRMDVVNRKSHEQNPYLKPEQIKPWEHEFFDLLQRLARIP